MDEIRLTKLSVFISIWKYYTTNKIYVNFYAEGYMHSRERVRDFSIISFHFRECRIIFVRLLSWSIRDFFVSIYCKEYACRQNLEMRR